MALRLPTAPSPSGSRRRREGCHCPYQRSNGAPAHRVDCHDARAGAKTRRHLHRVDERHTEHVDIEVDRCLHVVRTEREVMNAAQRRWHERTGQVFTHAFPPVSQERCRLRSRGAAPRRISPAGPGRTSERNTSADKARGPLLVEPDVFHAPAVVDAVDHDREPFDIGLLAGRAARIEDDRSCRILRQLPFDLPYQLLTLF